MERRRERDRAEAARNEAARSEQSDGSASRKFFFFSFFLLATWPLGRSNYTINWSGEWATRRPLTELLDNSRSIRREAASERARERTNERRTRRRRRRKRRKRDEMSSIGRHRMPASTGGRPKKATMRLLIEQVGGRGIRLLAFDSDIRFSSL